MKHISGFIPKLGAECRVEQYFADYLSVIESRKWENGIYTCHPLLNAAQFNNENSVAAYSSLLDELLNKATTDEDLQNGLKAYLLKNGIPLPFNLIVAGTVNMDETTHGFSRKVIDRALTFDFGEFFPNNFQQYFGGQPEVQTLTFPVRACVAQADLMTVTADPTGALTLSFLEKVNECLKSSPFQLAFRALNELLLATEAAKPADTQHLQAVWDDFLMQKVLPRIEGDEQKLFIKEQDGNIVTVLDELTTVLKTSLSEIWDDEKTRPDLYRSKGETTEYIACRSKKKIAQMQQKLTYGFTSFWP